MSGRVAPAWVRVDGVVRHYAWGSRRVLADLQGRPAPTGQPEAELWFGAYEACPSPVDDGSTAHLDGVIAEDPVGWLGARVAAAFGGRLPFLVKILAIAEPLSLQVHPGADGIRRGHLPAAGAGGPLDGDAVFPDAWPKPELLCALGEVSVLCGFLPHDQLVARLGRVTATQSLADELAARGPDGLVTVVERLLRWPVAERVGLVSAVLDASHRASSPAPPTGRAQSAGLDDAQWMGELATRYPADPAVAVAWLLQPRLLHAGEALEVPTGTPHCYLRGTALEAMASSDNVVRGGLTAKRVDVARFVDLLAPVADAPEVVPADPSGRTVYPASTPFFSVARGPAAALGPFGPGPELVVVVDGQAVLRHLDARLTLRPGQAALVRSSAEHPAVEVAGSGTAFRIGCPAASGVR